MDEQVGAIVIGLGKGGEGIEGGSVERCWAVGGAGGVGRGYSENAVAGGNHEGGNLKGRECQQRIVGWD